jgi:hypothetical protein
VVDTPTHLPHHANGKNIHRLVETSYIHCDSSCYGWGAVLNGRLEARNFWGTQDEQQHITWKELKAVLLELGTDSYTEVVPAAQGGRLW